MNSSKVTPLGTKVNNLVHPKYDVLQRLKFVSGLQFFIGINRLYLFVNHRYKIRISYVYSLTVVVLILFVIIRCEMKTATYLVFRNTSIIEYTLLSLNSILLYNKTLKKFFDRMEAFDDLLNIKNNAVLTFHSGYLLVFCFIFVMYIVLEMIYLQRIETVVGVELVPYTYLTIYFTFLAHDTEIFFFCVLLIMVMRRLKVIKGHVAKMFLGKQKKESKKLAALSYNANLDVSDLHRAYDTLHTCSEKLNSAMNFPMVLIFTASGLSSIMILKNLFRVIQVKDLDSYVVRSLVFYTVGHCLKFTILVILPCYFCNITTTQVTAIRSILHDALNTKKLEKFERRRLKAFFQLTRDSEFVYALWGVIKVDMSLPLSYCSLCVTYLIIVVQFSRFID